MADNGMSETDDVTSAKNTSSPIDVDEYLQSLDDEYAMKILPTFILLGAILIVGLLGNLIVCYIYVTKFKASTTKCFVLALALFDLLTCCIAIPGEIVDMRSNYTLRDVSMCKLFRFCNSFSCVGSGIVLIVVAGDRFRKICRPLSKQMTIKMAKIAVGLCCLFSVAVSWPAFILYGSRTVGTEYKTVNGTDCSTQDRFMGTLYPLIYNGVQFLIFITATSILVVLYGKIWRKISKQMKFRENKVTFSSSKQQNRIQILVESHTSNNSCSDVSPPTSDDVISNARCSPPTSDDVISNTRCSPLASDDVNSNSRLLSTGQSLASVPCTRSNLISSDPATDESSTQTHRPTHVQKTAGQSKKRRKSRVEQKVRRTTYMLFIISLVFVLSFLPHLGLMAARAIHKVMFDSLGDVATSAYNLFLRSFFIQSASNPIIYGFNNLQFRQECKALLVKLFCKRSSW